MEVLQAHTFDPWSQDKEDNDRQDVSHEDNSDQCIANNLSNPISQIEDDMVVGSLTS